MPSVGSVDATLRFNIISDKVTEAKSRLLELQEQFRAAGGAATASGAQIKESLTEQVTVIEDLQKRQAAAQAAMQNTINPNIISINRQTDAMMQAEIAAAKMAAAQQATTTTSTAATTSVTTLAASTQAAATSTSNLAAAATVVSRPVKQLGDDADEAGTKLSGLDRLATRMVERLLIFYALRETFNFVKGVFEASDAMVTLSEKTGASIDGLETFTKAGEAAFVPANALTAAVENLHKGLAEFKPEMAAGLDAIGLSFAKIQNLNFDQTLNAIMHGLQQLPTENERTRASMQLLGTDAIDPLIKKWDEAAVAAKKAIPSSEDVTMMADGARAYKTMTQEINDGATIALGGITRFIGEVNAIPLALLSGDVPVALELMREDLVKLGMNLPLPGSGLNRPFGSAAGSNFPGGLKIEGQAAEELAAGGKSSGKLYGEAFVKSIEEKVVEIGPELGDLLNRLRLQGELTLQNAVQAGATPDQFRKYLEIWREAEQAITDDDIAARNLDVQIMNVYQTSQRLLTLRNQESAVNFGTRDQIAMLRELDQQQKLLADDTINHLTGLKDRTRVTEEYARIHEQITKQILTLEREVTKETNAQFDSETKAKEALMARFGLTIGGGNLNANDPFINMQRQLDELFRNNPGEDVTERAQAIIQQYLDAEKKAADAAKSFADTLNKGASDLKAGADIFMSEFNSITGSTDLKGKTFFVQPRASGGPVEEGRPYLVGEAGRPELFIPGTGGTIMPIGGGMGSTNVNVYVQGVWDPATVRQMADRIGAEVLRRSNRQFSNA